MTDTPNDCRLAAETQETLIPLFENLRMDACAECCRRTAAMLRRYGDLLETQEEKPRAH